MLLLLLLLLSLLLLPPVDICARKWAVQLSSWPGILTGSELRFILVDAFKIEVHSSRGNRLKFPTCAQLVTDNYSSVCLSSCLSFCLWAPLCICSTCWTLPQVVCLIACRYMCYLETQAELFTLYNKPIFLMSPRLISFATRTCSVLICLGIYSYL